MDRVSLEINYCKLINANENGTIRVSLEIHYCKLINANVMWTGFFVSQTSGSHTSF